MKCRFLLFLSLGAVLLVSITALPQSDRKAAGLDKSMEVVVEGQVVDESGRPVSGAYVRIVWQCMSCPDQLFPGQHTLDQGSFRLIADKGSLPITVFIDDYLPKGYWAPLLYVPDEKRARFAPLRGIRLKRSGSALRMGTITIPYRYGFAEIDLKAGGEYHPIDAAVIDVDLEIFDERGELVDRGKVPRTVLVEGGGKLKLALPVRSHVSTWRLRLTCTDKSGRSIVFDHLVKLKQMECKGITQVLGGTGATPCMTNQSAAW